jgi:hypothetical protein
MVNLIFSPYWAPTWFQGYDLMIELLCFFVTFIISIYAYRIFRLIKEGRYLYFSLAMFFIAGAFFVRILAYGALFFIFQPISISSAHEIVRNATRINLLTTLGILIPIVLMLAAFMVLIAVNMKIKDKKLISLLFVLSFICSLMGAFLHQVWFYIISFVLLFYISHYFYNNYLQKRNANALLVLIAFSLFTISQGLFALSVLIKLAYVFAEIVQLISFVILLIGFIKVFRG